MWPSFLGHTTPAKRETALVHRVYGPLDGVSGAQALGKLIEAEIAGHGVASTTCRLGNRCSIP